MNKSRAILVLAIAAVVIAVALPCPASEKGEEQQNIFTEGERMGPGPGPGPEGGRGRGQGRGRFELTEEDIDRIMEGVKQRDPKKAEELAKIREKDPEKFQEELRRHGREEFGKIVRERIEKWRQERQAEFVKWLGENAPKEARELAKLKERNAELYTKKFELIRNKYWRIFEESRRNPELAEVLLEDLRLKERRDMLVGEIKAARSDNEKKKLTAELERAVSNRYDLIVRRKQIAYERLLKWLEELRNRIRESREDIAEAQDETVKDQNVKKRMQDLLEPNKGFNWD
jgi:hypothetical protein